MAFINGKSEIIHKLAFEIRYRLGLAFLDRSGRILNAIVKDQPEWIIRTDQISPQAASLASLRNGSMFTFGTQQLGLVLEKVPGDFGLAPEDISLFSEQANLLFAIVRDELRLSDFTRMGFRVWYLFPCSSKNESEAWVLKTGLFDVPDGLAASLGGALETGAASFLVSGVDRKLRVTINSVERNIQLDLGEAILSVSARQLSKDQNKVLREQAAVRRRHLENPEFGAIIDVDAYQEDPLSPEPSEFISTTIGLNVLASLQTVSDKATTHKKK